MKEVKCIPCKGSGQLIPKNKNGELLYEKAVRCTYCNPVGRPKENNKE